MVIFMDKIVYEKNYDQWSGLSEGYHDSRPVPPEIIIKIMKEGAYPLFDTVSTVQNTYSVKIMYLFKNMLTL